MTDSAVKIGGARKSAFKDKVMKLLPDGGNLNACLTCGACASGCPATGLEGMDPRKFLRMAALGMDEEILTQTGSGCVPCARDAFMYVPWKLIFPSLFIMQGHNGPGMKNQRGSKAPVTWP